MQTLDTQSETISESTPEPVPISKIVPYFEVYQPCIPPGSLNRVPASAGVKAGKSPLPGGR